MRSRLTLLIHPSPCLWARLFLLSLLLLIPNLYAASNIDSYSLKNNAAFTGLLLAWPFLKHHDSLPYETEADDIEPLPPTSALNSGDARLAVIEANFRALSQNLYRTFRLHSPDGIELTGLSIKAMAQHEFENDIYHQSDISHQIELQLFTAWLQDISNRYPHEELTRLLSLLKAIDPNSLANIKIRQVGNTPSGSASGVNQTAGADAGASGGMSSSNSGSGSENQRGERNNNSDDRGDSGEDDGDDPDKTLSDPDGASPRLCVNCNRPTASADSGASNPLTADPETIFNQRFCPECQKAHRDISHYLNRRNLFESFNNNEQQQRILEKRSRLLRRTPDVNIRTMSQALYNVYCYLKTVIAGHEYPLQIDLEQYSSIVSIDGLEKLTTMSQAMKEDIVDQIMGILVLHLISACAYSRQPLAGLEPLVDGTPKRGAPFCIVLCPSEKEPGVYRGCAASTDPDRQTETAVVIISITDIKPDLQLEYLYSRSPSW